MAWPPRRSRGRQTRRSRNLALLGQATTGVVLVLATILLLLSRYSPERFDALRSGAADIVAPIWTVILVPVAEIQAAAGSAAAYFGAVEKVRQLEGRERLYLSERQAYEQARRENTELKALLGVVEPDRQRIGVFAIAGSSTGAYVHQALISGGRSDGVLPGQPVRTVGGLLGRTVGTGRFAARVMLLTDISSRVPAQIVRTGRSALVIGKNMPLLDVDISGPSTADIQIGDRLVTSGDGGLFPPGLPIGTITRLKGNLPEAEPAAPPDGLAYVIVEAPYFPAELPDAPDLTSAGEGPDE